MTEPRIPAAVASTHPPATAEEIRWMREEIRLVLEGRGKDEALEPRPREWLMISRRHLERA